MTLQLLIFSTADALRYTERSVARLRQRYPADQITIWCPDDQVKGFERALKKAVRIYGDSELDPLGLVRHGLMKREHLLRPFRRLPGWYYQQFLKMAAAASFGRLVVVVDGDTVLNVADLMLREQDRRIPYTRERAHGYRRFLDAYVRGPANERSFIANYGFIDGKVLLESMGQPRAVFLEWVDCVIEANGTLDISEYQLFGRLMARVGWRMSPVRLFRRADLLTKPGRDVDAVIAGLIPRYEAIAFEPQHHSSSFYRSAARLYAWANLSW